MPCARGLCKEPCAAFLALCKGGCAGRGRWASIEGAVHFVKLMAVFYKFWAAGCGVF